jgi:photosystem II stability/assembly factor-like uncharacterized protein
MRIVTRKRVVVAGLVAAWAGVFAGIGALSKSTPAGAAAALPFVPWYWSMAVSASDPNAIVLATSNGLYRSADGGKTWASAGPKNLDATSVVGAGSSIYAGGVTGAAPVSPVIRKGSGRVAPDGAGVLALSPDGGKTWQVLHPRGLPSVTVQAMAADTANGTAVYVLLNTGSLYRSTDGARSFELLSSKFGVAPWALAITQNHLSLAGDMDGGPYASANGKAWKPTAFKDPRGGHMVMEYAVQPTDSTRVLMTSVGIVMSTNGGKTWHPSLKSTVMFGPVGWAPSKANTAYAVGFDRSVWRSDDGGKSWTKVA